MKKQCPSCGQFFTTEYDLIEIAMLFGSPEEREYWLSGLCSECQAQVFTPSIHNF